MSKFISSLSPAQVAGWVVLITAFITVFFEDIARRLHDRQKSTETVEQMIANAIPFRHRKAAEQEVDSWLLGVDEVPVVEVAEARR